MTVEFRKCSGIMGVPITALDKLDPEMFGIVGMLDHPVIGGKNLYKRLLIRRRCTGQDNETTKTTR